MDLETTIGSLVEGLGLELVEATFRKEGGRRVLRVIVDRDGGVDLDTIAETSEKVSRRLDALDFAGDASYTLEVSSPGVERPLRRPADFARRLGEKVKVKTFRPIDGARSHVGEIVAADEEAVTVRVDGAERTLAFDDIASARTVFEWGSGAS
ncbi:MAG TPA: ribosome maturation factor RimP [Actinomycetota bacterium]|nr:ribosome maturation factor RimP [Actinomycetota bacterium]